MRFNSNKGPTSGQACIKRAETKNSQKHQPLRQTLKLFNSNSNRKCSPASSDSAKQRQPEKSAQSAKVSRANKMAQITKGPQQQQQQQLNQVPAQQVPIACLAQMASSQPAGGLASCEGQRMQSIGRQHLAARAKSIIAKLLDSHGAELRRTLFSLRQIFQDDLELATEFVELDGIECLMKVALNADQIHQNYILRALGQLIATPSGMNGLAKHSSTTQWLYTLLASQHRLVVKTSVKLLLLFVEHSDSNCLHFCRSIRLVEQSKGNAPWTSAFKLLKSTIGQFNLDPENGLLAIDLMSLINKTLAGIPDQETYYDFVDPLEELGMESLIAKNLNLDSKLRREFEIYEQVLGTEDERLVVSEQQQVSGSRTAENNIDNSGSKITMVTSGNARVCAKSSDSEPSEQRCQQQQQLELELQQRRRSKRCLSKGQQQQIQTLETMLDDDVDQYESANDNEQVSSSLLAPKAASVAKKVIIDTHQHHKVSTIGQSSSAGQALKHQHRHTFKPQRQASASPPSSPPSSSTSPAGAKPRQGASGAALMNSQQQLARGKQQQRASISSCSSSDSYASYGSGYASGSGNSTDHELKQQQRQRKQGQVSANNQQQQQANLASTSVRTNFCPTGLSSSPSPTTNENNQESESEKHNDTRFANEQAESRHTNELAARMGKQASEELEEEHESEFKLKQHLSELEQLTDDLAGRRAVLSDISNRRQAIGETSDLERANVANDSNHRELLAEGEEKFSTANIKSSASSGSSILSTGSDSASSLYQEREPVEEVSKAIDEQASEESERNLMDSPASPLGTEINNDSRSTSTTPTLISIQQKQHNLKQQQLKLQLKFPTNKQQQMLNAASNGPSKSMAASAEPPASNTRHQAQQQQQSSKQEPYYHNLFQWEQLISKGVSRPLLINDLDFTDLRDEDDCDLLNQQAGSGGKDRLPRQLVNGEPLTISIPYQQQLKQKPFSSGANDEESSSLDSGTGTGSPKSAGNNLDDLPTGDSGERAQLPPPMPPPPISPWFNTISGGSRPQSQLLLSSPSPTNVQFGDAQGDQYTNYSNYSRNSVCIQSAGPQQALLQHQSNTLQPVSSLRSASSMSSLLFGNNGKLAGLNKRKKTMKLFWKEVREDRSLLAKLTKKKTIWDEIKPIEVDTQKLEYLFESKAKDLLLSKSRNGLDALGNQRKLKITVLDAKRSNAINIGMTKLPPMRTIKSAILKMDSSIMNREGIEKILTTMMPSEEEKSRIIEAQLANPDTPLGTAEQFLLNLASISALEARLKLWAFQLDYAQIEKEVAEPLMDLKQAIEEIENSETFRIILGTLLSIGNFLNSTNVKGFQIDYLEKVPEVKDTVHKHSLLHHLCLLIQEKYDPELVKTSDLYSEFSAVNRASKVDYTEVGKNLKKMQQDCKLSWDYLKIVAKHDGLANLMNSCSSTAQTNGTQNATECTSSSKDNFETPVKSAGKLNNLSKLSMITTITGTESASSSSSSSNSKSQSGTSECPTKQLKIKVSDFLTDCAERIMVLVVIHRRIMNRYQKLLVYLGCPSSQIKQTQPQQILKIINEFALEYRTKRERVREMLLKKQQCKHHHHLANRWQLNSRARWAGSQQYIDSLGNGTSGPNPMRPCSTASSCASSLAAANQHQAQCRLNRAQSPSGMSQISNYSDYLNDQCSSCCNSRQQSVTPSPMEPQQHQHHQQQQRSRLVNRRPYSMSISMYDLQQQQQQQNHHNQNNINEQHNLVDGAQTAPITLTSNSEHHADQMEDERKKDEQLRRLLGAGKSLDGTCSDLYQMNHWLSTMSYSNRAGTKPLGRFRAASIDSNNACQHVDGLTCEQQAQNGCNNRYASQRCNNEYDDDYEPNSDEEILQSIVRTATCKGSTNNINSSNGHNVDRSARNKILSRFNYDRKSSEYSIRLG